MLEEYETCVADVPDELGDVLYEGLRWGGAAALSEYVSLVPAGLTDIAAVPFPGDTGAWVVGADLHWRSETAGTGSMRAVWRVEGSLASPTAVYALNRDTADLSNFPAFGRSTLETDIFDAASAAWWCSTVGASVRGPLRKNPYPQGAPTPASETTVPESRVSISDIDAGDCINDPGFRMSHGLGLEIVSCDSPHDFEVFSVLDLNDVAERPGDAEIHGLLDGCADDFALYTGEPFEYDGLRIGMLVPDASAWERGERTIACYIYSSVGRKNTSLAAEH